jgi:hypothetical protein
MLTAAASSSMLAVHWTISSLPQKIRANGERLAMLLEAGEVMSTVGWKMMNAQRNWWWSLESLGCFRLGCQLNGEEGCLVEKTS